MAQYQCKSCGEIEVSDLNAPKDCAHCGESGAIDLDAQTAEIAKANDAFRAAIIQGGHAELRGQVVCTLGVAAEGLGFMARAQIEVAGFASFTEENDPYRLCREIGRACRGPSGRGLEMGRDQPGELYRLLPD